QTNLNKVTIAVRAVSPTAEIATQLIALLDFLIQDCCTQLPQIDPTKHRANELDMRRQEMRNMELARIKAEATKLRENATDVNEVVNEIEGYIQALRQLAVEPQNSIPDIVIWMLSARKRIAYFRIPAYDVLYSPYKDASGKFCNKLRTIFLKYPGTKSENAIGAESIPCMLRLKVWLGLQEHEQSYGHDHGGGLMAVFAETVSKNHANLL
ncbi:myoferlin-like, partial [Saccoglossus kowalevskii]|uniref:Myoferlin-like n=1 Tax=Saccoglossus kowalevskii TaxID=10224 RepID=A0ABM0LYT2_SACKO